MELYEVDWAALPQPADDGKASHLLGSDLPDVALKSTEGNDVSLGSLRGISVFYFYPKTGQPGTEMPEGWDMIPGARGCTPQSCAFRDHFAQLQSRGVSNLFGVSTQSNDYQAEVAERLHLPFALLSDADRALQSALDMPVIEVEGEKLYKRLTMIARDGKIERISYPVFPPDQDPQNVLSYLESHG